ncbi:MAG: Flp pilus assembly protein CpaB [Devosia sp.]|nr:Flp pilus assembly protein CpaB [Devosia sp.]
MRPARIVLLLIAIIAGGLAAYLATRGNNAPTVEQAAAPQQAPSAQVLVATQQIGVGERLSAATVEWQAWPQNAVRTEYITSANSPDAPTKIAGSVARFEIFAGEPILDAKLVHSNQGYLSAVLDPGMRGVSIQVSAASGSGGFIIPNDRVDVVVTQTVQGQTQSQVLLSNIKVLAIGTRLGQTGTTGAPTDPADPKSQIFTDAIATLELTPTQGDTLINATALGKISLVLRSVADFGQTASTDAGTTGSDSQAIKIIRFGRILSVTPGSSPEAGVNPVSYVAPATTVTTTTAPATPTPEATPAAPAASPTTTTTTTTTAVPSTEPSMVRTIPMQ